MLNKLLEDYKKELYLAEQKVAEKDAEIALLKEDYNREFEHAKSCFATGQSFKQRAEAAEKLG
jgi:hypothetical protein